MNARFLPAVILSFVCCVSAFAQSAQLYLKFDGTLTDSAATPLAGLSVTPSTGFTPTFSTDRNGQASKALVLPGSASLQVLVPSSPGNSDEALGIRGSGTTPFTLAAWVYFDGVGAGQGYNTIFGNTGSGAGTLHAGLGNNSDKAHFGFDGNDADGAVVSFDPGVWYHVAYVFDGSAQRIYVNGVPEVTRSGVTNTLKAADLFIGNWGAADDANNDLKGRLDDVVVYNAALSAAKVQALYNGVDPNNLPAVYSGPKLPGTQNTDGFWGVREIKNYPGITYGSLVNAERIIRSYAQTPGGTALNYQAPVINMIDPDMPGDAGAFGNEATFATNIDSQDDNNIAILAKGTVRIAVEDDYTFGFIGDEGSRLRILNQTFLSSSAVNGSTGNPAVPANQGDGIYWTGNTTNSGTVGVVHLTPGDYNLELTYWEGTGGSSVEVFAARGAKTAIDSSFQLVGNPAAGGLPLVRDPDTYPSIQSFTANGGNPFFVHAGAPASFLLAWQTNGAVVPATTVTIDQGIGVVSASGSTTITSPTQTTTYTITATNGVETATKSLTIYVNTAPVFNSFTADPTRVEANANVTLSWSVDGAASLLLQPGNIDVTGKTTIVVNPAVATTYTLFATNPSGTTPQSVTVQVGFPPTITSFTAADPNPLYGAETSLSWVTSGATTLSINQGIGTVPGPTGSISVIPLVTTTYTLVATNAAGSVSANVTVNQPTPIGVNSTKFTARRVFATSTTPFPFAGQGYLQSALSLIGTGPNTGQNELRETTQTGYATVNFTDGIDGDFTSGNSAFPGASSGTNYAVQITGTLVINTPGTYTFVVNSSFGSRLRIDGQDLIVDDGSHSPGSSTGTINLTKPTAQLELITYGAASSCEVELGWIRPNQQFALLNTINPAAPIVRGQLLISEFLADNSGTIMDEDNASSDWIEIWNSTNATVNLTGYSLSDDPALPNKWAFPAWTLGPNQFLIVFASAKDRRPAQVIAGQDNPGTIAQPHLHTNFKLSKTGGNLFLNQSNGAGGFTVVSSFIGYPAQREDVSYGSSDAEGYIGFMEVPTPGATNSASFVDFVGDTNFSVHRGRFSAPFSLTITTSTPGATIRYTTDGSTPTVNHGTIYTASITISKTTVIRAAAFKPGWKPTNVDSESYLFVDDIATQTTSTALALGFPSSSINGQIFRYGLNLANVTSAGGNLQSLKNALTAIPTVSMTTDVGNLTNVSTGIYVNPDKHGLFWERPVSIEYINVAGTSEFQIDCGARIRGGFSRSTSNPKHAFHLFFRNSLYQGKLNYKLFGLSGASEFGQIDMRCEENYSWSFQNDAKNLAVREEWSRIAQGDMGQPYARNGYFHLYINGLYWGLYNWEERTEADYGETYLGGTADTTDAIKSAGSSGGYLTEATDGNFAAWQNLFNQCVALKRDTSSEANRTAKYMQMQGLNPDGTRNPAYPVLLDVDNLIDYLLVIFYDGSFDAPLSTFLNNGSNNWFGVRDRNGTRGFAFFAHDNEHGFDTMVQSYNRVGPWGGSGNNNWGQAEYNTRETFNRSNPQYLHELLAYSTEYRQRFADRVQKHFFNGGALTTTASLNRFNALAAQVDLAIHAEAARWGSTSLNRNSWLSAKTVGLNYINNGGTSQSGQTVFPVQPRTSLVLTQLKGYIDVGAKSFFPALSPPAFSGQFGGPVSTGYTFQVSNGNASGAIYYTVNGSDPRPIGGGAPAANALTGPSPISVTLNNTSTVRARIFDTTTQTWSALTEAEYLVGTLASATNLVISKINYNPPGSGDLQEFIEVMNIGATTIDLTNAKFTLGIQFQFTDGYLLPAGARALIVRDMAAFTTAYPSVPVASIVGIFANGTNLANGGTRLQLLDASNVVIRDFSYDNKSPWPTSPDGGGPCLVLLRPETNPDHSNPANWRASVAVGGTPGLSDALSYSAWALANNVTDPLANDDGDGLANLAEYGLGSNPKIASSGSLPVQGTQTVNVGGVVSDYLTITFTRAIGRDDVSYIVEGTTTLTGTWTPAVIVGSPVFNGDGTETLTYRYPDPVTAQSQQFLHLRITRLP